MVTTRVLITRACATSAPRVRKACVR
jgi:hypothetical protein